MQSMNAALSRREFLCISGATIVATFASGCGKKVAAGLKINSGSSVLALGDSLTAGVGAAGETSYPGVLARLTGWSVVNAGVSGDTSAQALERLPALLLEHAPQLLLVSIGGNDFLRRLPEVQTRANVRKICELALTGGSQVVLIAIPAFSPAAAIVGSLSDHPMFHDIAQSLKLPLHAEGWSTVLGNPSLRSDQIHANAKGYAQFAQGLMVTLKAARLV